MEMPEIRELLELQSGVVTRRQLVETGAALHDVRRWVRKRNLVPLHDGVYVNHTGPVSWSTRAWSAVLLHSPAALTHESVVHAAGDVIHVAVDPSRKLSERRGIRVHRLGGLDERVLWHLSPPRVRLEDAVLSLCAEATSRSAALAVAADVCRRRRTTPERLLTELAGRPRLRHRAWLLDVLTETAQGVQSPLESSYLRRVERAHGLPRGVRQLREVTGRGVVYRDIAYEHQGVYVELDGRVGHELSAERWNDMDRDLEAASSGRLTVRVGWRHAEDRPCETAGRLAEVLRARGWRGVPRRCGPSCRIDVRMRATR